MEPMTPPAPKAYAPKAFAPKRSSFKPPPPPASTWKCRPCGTGFTPPVASADEDAVRCPSCNAKLGLAGDFRQDPPNLDRLRARPVNR